MWLFISFASYLLNAFAVLVDKALLKRSIPHPVTYTFYVSVLSLFAFLLTPFGFYWPGTFLVLVGILSGLASTFALLFFFSSLREGEASRVSPFVGGLVPIFILFLAWIILGEFLTSKQIFAFIIIMLGSYLISRKGSNMGPIPPKVIFWSIAAAFLFALSHTLAKYIYIEHSFSSGFIWRAVGTFLGALFLILPNRTRRIIFDSFHRISPKMSFIFLFGQIAAASAFILLNYAFTLGPIALTNALSGVQHVFVFFFVLLLAKNHPGILEETLTPATILRKIFSIILIGGGVFLLFV
ncbi:MAG: DMT family transporter [Patescibacteria group bacterium]